MADQSNRKPVSRRRRQPPMTGATRAVGAVAGVVVLAFGAMFPVALYSNSAALVDGYRASHGQAGTPGTVTLTDRTSATRGGEVCHGDFAPGDGGPTVAVVVELPGPCTIGDHMAAHLPEPRFSIFTGYGEPRAWVVGSTGWWGYLLLTGLFAVLTGVPLVIVVRGLLGSLRRRRRAATS